MLKNAEHIFTFAAPPDYIALQQACDTKRGVKTMQYPLQMVQLSVTFMCRQAGNLPAYLGSTIRGIMGRCFRKFACSLKEKRCFLCSKREQCMYVQYFCNTGKTGGAINPFVIHVWKDGQTVWAAGDTCVFDLTLFGHAAESANFYLDVLLEMGEIGWGASRLQFQLVQIADTRTRRLVYVQGRNWNRNLTHSCLEVEEREAAVVLISFDSPFRIVTGGELCPAPSFSTLIQFIIRRAQLMAQVHAGQKLTWDEEGILQSAVQIRLADHYLKDVDFERYSMNQKDNKLKLKAAAGWMLFEGELNVLIPILEIGKYLHVGKGTTIGFGHYETFYDR